MIEAFRKIFRESPSFLITVSTGYNGAMDDYLFVAGARPNDVDIRFMVRSDRGNDWCQEVDPAKARRPTSGAQTGM